jgi:hypothetical protein
MHGLEFYFQLLKSGGQKSYSGVDGGSDIGKDMQRVDTAFLWYWRKRKGVASTTVQIVLNFDFQHTQQI